jgi:Abnormal spindle-like microcephaly-assoc'd, ASPM-SPD-2-Hydin
VGAMHVFHRHHLKSLVLRFVILAVSLTSTASLASPLAARLSPAAFLYASRGPLSCSPGTMWFRRVAVGESKSEPAFMINTGSTTITVLTMSQSPVGFGLSGLNLPLTLSPGQKAPFIVSFIPQVSGHVDGNFAFTSDAFSGTLSLYVHGTGFTAGNITVSPSAVVFGSVQVGKSALSPRR